jgi:hypothetical protein
MEKQTRFSNDNSTPHSTLNYLAENVDISELKFERVVSTLCTI